MPAPNITTLPTPPSRSQSPDTFSTDADAFLGALPGFGTEANAQADYLDALAITVDADATAASNAAAIAIGAANYQGDYNAGTTYQIGESVSYNSYRWIAKIVTTGVTPAAGANWFQINDGDVLGPNSATTNSLAIFDGTTGKLLKSPLGNGTLGALLSSGGSGNAPAFLGQGNSGQILASGGAGVAPSWVEPPSSSVRYVQNIQSADYTLVLGDAGKMIFHPASDTLSRTYTIPDNGTVAFPIGTVLRFTVEDGGAPVKIAINSDMLVSGNGLTGTVRITQNNTLTAIKVTATKWMANLDYQVSDQSIIFGGNVVGVAISPWSGAGFGYQFNVANFSGGGCTSIAVSENSDFAIAGSGGTPYLNGYRLNAVNLGRIASNPSPTPTGTVTGVAFSPSTDVVAASHLTTPFVSVYAWSASGFGAKFANPATLPTGNGRGVAFSPTGDAIAVCHDTTPFISVYPWSVSGFGTKFANPVTLPSGNATGVAFSPSGDAIAITHNLTPFVTAYPWGVSGFGTKFANPTTLPASTAYCLAFNPIGDTIAIGHTVSPHITVYRWSSAGFGTKFANPDTNAGNDVKSVAFSKKGDAIAIALVTSPWFRVYKWDNSGFRNIFPPALNFSSENVSGNAVAFALNT